MLADKIIIKKFPNRKLYNTNTDEFLSARDIVALIKQGHKVQVFDARRREEITRQFFCQILFFQDIDQLDGQPEDALLEEIKQMPVAASPIDQIA